MHHHPHPPTLLSYIESLIEQKKSAGKVRCCETYTTTLNSLRRFTDGLDIDIGQIDQDFIVAFEASLRARGLCKNTTSFYLRILRTVLNRACDESLVPQPTSALFRQVYTGIDDTKKRALSTEQIRQIMSLRLIGSRELRFARDMFMLSFYLRGMSFIDMAHLRHSNIVGRELTYVRHKTRRRLSIRWEPCMQDIVDSYAAYCTDDFLLPIITGQSSSARSDYRNQLAKVNRNLSKIGKLAGLTRLTMYVARHSWATIAQTQNVPINVISSAMGHNNESTTRIYLQSICAETINEANAHVISSIFGDN